LSLGLELELGLWLWLWLGLGENVREGNVYREKISDSPVVNHATVNIKTRDRVANRKMKMKIRNF